MSRVDVIVIGGGAIGLACARALARSKRTVLLLERGRTGEEATRAAGGMLSPLGESSGPGAFLSLGLRALAVWPTFAAEVGDEGGVDVDLRLDGKLRVALDEAAAGRLRARREWIEAAGQRAEWIDGTALSRELGAGGAVAGLLLPQEGQVDNRALARALRAAAERTGCRMREGSRVAALVTAGGRAAGVRLEDGEEIGADAVVLAAGAWSGTIAGLPRPLPVRPVKGQMIALAAAPAPALRTVLESEACYVIPRGGGGGSVWVGASSEEVGFERGTTREARDALRGSAAELLPYLAHARELEAWDGFRPGTPDDLPVLGPDPALPGLVHASGHYRNGILLTPITAELTLAAVEGVPEPRLDPFRPDRFQAG